MRLFSLRGILHGYVRIISVDTSNSEMLLLYRGAFDSLPEELMESCIIACNPTRHRTLDICVSAYDVVVMAYLEEYDFDIPTVAQDKTFNCEDNVPILDNGNILSSNGNL